MAAYSPGASLDLSNPKDTYNLSSNPLFPIQTVSFSTKIGKDGKVTDWGKQCMDFLGRMWREDAPRRRAKVINYRFINGEYSSNDYMGSYPYDMTIYKDSATTENNNGEEQILGEVPKEIVHYPISTIPLQALWGEEVQRPFNFRAKSEDSSSTNEYLRTKTDLIHEYVKQSIQQEIQNKLTQQGIDPQSKEGQDAAQAMTPPEIEKYMRRNFGTAAEVTDNAILRKYIKKLNIREIFNKGWVDATAVAEVVFWIGSYNKEATIECVNTVNISVDKALDLPYIDEAEKIARGELMSASTIIDRYREYLTEDEIKDISNYNVYNSNPGNGNLDFVDFGGFSFYPFDNQKYPLFPGYNVPEFNYYGGVYGNGSVNNVYKKKILVIHGDWASYRRLAILTILNEETGKPEVKILDGEFNLNDPLFKDLKDSGATVQYTWIQERWQGTKIGDKIYCKIQPNANQHKSINKLYGAKSGYTGGYFNDRNTTPTSLLDQMKPYNELFNIMMDKLRSLLNTDLGNITVFDLTQVPSGPGWNFEKFMYFIQEKHLMPINTAQEGASKTFNQVHTLQTSALQLINGTVNFLEYLENQCNRMVGFTPQRLGDVKATETATATNAALDKSYTQTEHYFRLFNNIKARALTNLLEEIKFNLEEGYEDTYFLDDLSIAYLQVTKGYKFSDSCVYISDSAKDQEMLQAAKQMVQPALQNGAGLAGAFTLITEENISVLKEKLEEIDRLENEYKQAEQQLKAKEIQDKKDLELEKMDREDNNKQLDRESNERIAQDKIFAAAELGAKDIDVNDNSIPDAYEIGTLNLKASELAFKNAQHSKELAHDRQDKNEDRKLKEKELGIKEKDIVSKEKQHSDKLKTEDKQMKNDLLIAKINAKNKPKPSKPKTKK